MRRWLGACLGLFVTAAFLSTALCQESSKRVAMDKHVDPDWEVLSVRPSDPDSKAIGYNVQGDQILLRRQTLEAMMMVGFGLHKKQIVDAPEWARSVEWEVRGKPDAPGEPDSAQIRSLVRKALIERFGLKTHPEQREMPVFALTVTKGSVKISASTSDPDGLPDENDRESGGESTVIMTNVSMANLVTLLDFRLERPVVDRTGLSGRYDLKFTYTMDESRPATDRNAAPGLFTALQEQLGLKLEPEKTAADVLVIDKVERPSAN